MPLVALSIAGFDPSNGAGVTADLAVFAAHGLFGTSAITTLTVQSTLGVAATEEPSAHLLRRTLNHLWADLPAQGIKVGALGNAANAEVLADFLASPALSEVPVVLDPVLVSSSGRPLFPAEGLPVLLERVLPLVSWVTPNWSELAVLAGIPVANLAEAETATEILAERFPQLQIVATGGDQETTIDILRVAGGKTEKFAGEKINSKSTHGTGCAFSSALLARLMAGNSPVEAVGSAKRFVEEAIRRAPGLGGGRGPMDLLWPLR